MVQRNWLVVFPNNIWLIDKYFGWKPNCYRFLLNGPKFDCRFQRFCDFISWFVTLENCKLENFSLCHVVQLIKLPTCNVNSRCSIPCEDNIFQRKKIFEMNKYKLNAKLMKSELVKKLKRKKIIFYLNLLGSTKYFC